MGRRNTNLRMEDAPRRVWFAYARLRGVTLTALIEELGRELKRNPELIPPEVIERARRVTSERRQR